jgi:hypothetical protein
LGDGESVAARQAYQDPATGPRIKPGTNLADAYQQANLPVAKRRLYRAGARLAVLLAEEGTAMNFPKVPLLNEGHP